MEMKNTRREETQITYTPASTGNGAKSYIFPLEGKGGRRPDEGESKLRTFLMNLTRVPLTCPNGHPLPQGRGGTTRGFTLIELLVVVLIIAILAAVALPQYNKAVKKSQGTEALIAIDALDKELTSHYLEHGTYTDIQPDTFAMPELKHFHWHIGCKPPTEGVWLWDTQNDKVTANLYKNQESNLLIYLEWKNGQFKKFTCNGVCSEYFNCISGGEKVWTGSSWQHTNCTLK